MLLSSQCFFFCLLNFFLNMLQQKRPSGLQYFNNQINDESSAKIVEEMDRYRWDDSGRGTSRQYGHRRTTALHLQHALLPAPPIPASILDLWRVISCQIASLCGMRVPDQCVVESFEPGEGLSSDSEPSSPYDNTIVIVSFITPALIHFFTNDSAFDIKVEPNSVLILSDEVRYRWFKSVDSLVDVMYNTTGKSLSPTHGRRVSLTFRWLKGNE